jgi:hypothetical protein
VKNIELSNLYLDISQEILGKSLINNSEELIFIVCVEKSLSYLADYIYDNSTIDLKPIEHLNCLYKWKELSNSIALRNIITKELSSEGLFSILEKSKSIFFREDNKNLITTSEINDLKKFNLIIDRYKAFKELLRKTLDEC